MTDKMVHVFVDLEGVPHLVGQLWAHTRKGRDSASFQYNAQWLNHPDRFELEPALLLMEGAFHTHVKRMIFGSIGDSAPDSWGRVLMRRQETRRAKTENRQTRTLNEIDYLLGVNDEARQGALRFAEEIKGPFLGHSDTVPIPPLIDLPRLLSATERLLDDKESEEDLKLLLAPGSSLGGARPKASVRDKDGQLAIAKFPRQDDEFLTVLWEGVALTLAEESGIEVPKWRIEMIAGKPVLIIRRFDRNARRRYPFLSAMSMIDALDNEQHSYLELVDALRQYGAMPKQDIVNLWRRIVFSIMISNTDDHLRNHGFLYERQQGWKLSPLYDVNPTPIEISPRIVRTAIDLNDSTASLELALSVASEFELKLDQAKAIAKEVGMAVSKWRMVARDMGISSTEMGRMSSAFEHRDLEKSIA